MQVVTFMVSMSVGLLWTFGLIIMVTQKMHSEVAESGKLLKSLNKQKDTFFSILAHDLRGPFASMINLSEVLTEGSDHLTPLQKREITISLYKTAVSTNELLEDLLEWSGIHRGMKTFHPTETEFGKIMSHTFSSIKMSASNKNIELVVKIPDNIVIYTDHYMFQTIFRNLIINAIKFTSEGGSIVLQLEKDTYEDQVFSVTDNGIGMNREIIDSLFRIDVKSNRPGTNGEISTGFGLLLCKEFVEKHGGTIWAESEEGKGSKFFFSLKKMKNG
jgi:signal transduction histidine kinase